MSMHVWATKDLHERENDEAERLVRPAPKVKPPRHDRRREETQAERDPDVDADKDTNRDPDLSLNRKNVGGSSGAFVYPFVVYRVASRFLRADIDRSSGEWVSVVNTETGNRSRIKKETLKGPDGAKYKVVEQAEDEDGGAQTKPEDKPAAPEEKKPEAKPGPSEEAVTQLRQLAESNPQVKGMIDILSNPKHKEYTTLTSLPNIPLASMLKDVKMPEGVSTIGDFHKAVSQMAKKPSEKKPAEGAPTSESKPKEKKQQAPVDADAITKAITENLPKVVAEQVSKALEQAFAKFFPQGGPKNEEAKPAEGKPAEAPPAKAPDAKEGEAPPPSTPEEQKPVDEPSAKKPKGKPKKEPPKPLGPPPPERPEASPEEKANADAALKETFPPEIADHLLSKNLHPQDVSRLVSDFRLAREHDVDPANVSKFAQKISQNFHTDPDKVEPPEHVEKDGKEVKFADLTPEEQSEAMQEHRIRTVAMSLAAREQVSKTLSQGLGAPKALADKLAATMLRRGTPEEKAARASEEAKRVFADGLTADVHDEISDGEVKSILRNLSADPAAQKVATAYFQARDYQMAREKYLDSSSPDHISEYQSPKEIAKRLSAASEFLSKRAEMYPEDAREVNAAAQFRTRVLDKVKALAPEKYPFVRDRMVDFEGEEYEASQKRFEKDEAAFHKTIEQTLREVEKEQKKIEKAQKSGKPYRAPDEGLSVQERVVQKLRAKGVRAPRKPVSPPWYDWWKARSDREDAGKSLWDKFLGKFKTAAGRVEIRWQLRSEGMPGRVLYRWASSYSSYPGTRTMGNPSDRGISASGNREAVYWGVGPYPKGNEGFEPYAEWQQAHACDLGEADYNGILTAARDWLKQSVLTVAIEGIVPDTQYRAALDLALRSHADGKYSVGLHPTVYNGLLARLAGKSQKDTLLTVREASSKSTYGVAPGEVHTMKASAEITAFAARVASTHPELAYDLMALADRVAGEIPPQFKEHMKEKKDEGEKKEDEGQKKEAAAYQGLRALVIKTAAQHPEAREAFLPILQSLKNG